MENKLVFAYSEKSIGIRRVAVDWRYWASFVVFSILLHVAFLWPLPAPPIKTGGTRPLIVSLAQVHPVDLPSEPEPIEVEYSYTEQELDPQLKIQNSGVKAKISSSKSGGLKTKVPLPRKSFDESLGVESQVSKLEMADNPVVKTLQEDPNPSISMYRLALAAEVIQTRASIERLVEPDFKGRLVVLVVLRGPNATPQVSLDEATGSERLDRGVLAAFKRAAEIVPVSIAGEVGEVSIRLPVYFDQATLD